MIELGGNIFLDGFNELNGGEMVIIKKLVGNYVKEVTEKKGDFQKLSLNLNTSNLGEKDVFHLQAELHAGDKYNSEARDGNLFFAIDKALKDINTNI
ncbi:hypothetical protein HOC35_03995 [Candidatus Woesearchaeota archaeon]|jgi:hypothetical protein|nr:hypothetical protein [Candidatus Woesearchaeota archaeon]